jgi:hypothetical protein
MWVELYQTDAVDTSVLDVIHTAMYQHYHHQLLHYCYWYLCIELHDSVAVEEHSPTESLSESLG